MSEERTQAATPNRNPITTGEYVPDATPEAGSTRPTGPHRPGAAADLPDIPGYAVTHELARGGMGRVLAATDLGFGREVAVKVLLPGFDSGEAAGRFVREARITGRLTHPGIPPAHHLGMLADGSPFLAMKLVRGRTLAALLHDRDTPAHDLPRFVGIVEQICQAVGFAHARGVVHRDLKPANVMVGEFGEVQVMDWGLAFETDDGGGMRAEPGTFGDSSLTAAGAVMGTPAYMAPEQARGELVGAAADVFALGGILCEVLTGSRPFRGSSGAEVVAKAAAGDVSDALARIDACGADAELIDVARRCLSPAATDRPADGTAVAGLVAAYRAGVEERLRTAERERAAAEAKAEEEANTRREAEARALEQRRRKRVQLWLAASAVLLVAGAGGVAVWRVDEDGKKRAEATRLEIEERDRVALASVAVENLLDRAKVALVDGDADRAAPLLAQAERRAVDGAVAAHADRRAEYAQSLAVLRALDEVNDFRWTLKDSRTFPTHAEVAERWAVAFANFGLVPGTTPPAEAIDRLNKSPVRPALLAGLDGWLARSRLVAIRDLLADADPDPFRDEVRRTLASGDRDGLVALAGRVEWVAQPSGLVLAYGGAPAVPSATERELLLRLVVERRTDFAVMMQIAWTYSINAVEAVGERVRWAQAAVALRPRSTIALIGLGVALREQKDWTGAAAACREVIRLDPKYALAHNNLGLVLYEKGDTEAAVAEYREAMRLDPRSALPHYNIGNVFHDKGELDAAVASYREAIRLDPEHANCHNNLGNVHYEKGAMDVAAASYREAIRLDPKDARPHNNIGNVFHDKGELTAAAAAYRQAIRLDPKFAFPHNNLGNVLRDEGELNAAAAEYREAIRLDPKFALAHNNLGLIYEAQLDLERAECEYRESVRLNPRNAPAHANLGDALRKQGRHADAIVAYRAALSMQANLGYARVGLNYCLRVQRGEVLTAPPPRAVGR